MITRAEFVKSSTTPEQCPQNHLPEFALIGRSNVGKSSLFNRLVNRKGLAKTSGRPGKTQTINHFLINDSWYLVDLPGYGFAKVSKTMRDSFEKMIFQYLQGRPGLICLFILIDIRHDPQAVDVSFMEEIIRLQIPMAVVFTKADKLSKGAVNGAVTSYQAKFKKRWEHFPPTFVTSADTGVGCKELAAQMEAWLPAQP
jgi:GTP-binding protein